MFLVFSLFALVFGMLTIATPAQAGKPANNDAYIKSGKILDKFGDVINLGFNDWGYNYEAHIFNGKYCDAYGNADWCQQFKDVSLLMKWNDAWLSNMDKDGNHLLDRHYGFDSYIGSGAWLTNHANNTYESSVQYNWDVSGSWKIAVNGGAYNHDYTFTTTSLSDGTFTGVGGYPAGATDYTFDEVVINGQIVGDNISFTAVYYINSIPTGYSWTATGTIDASGNMSGTGTSGVVNWSSTSGTANKVYKICTVSDFVKIVAVPETAVKDSTVSGYYGEGMWYTDDSKTTEIGPVIWGEFAVIQEEASDPCGEYGVINYFSPFKKGLGNW